MVLFLRLIGFDTAFAGRRRLLCYILVAQRMMMGIRCIQIRVFILCWGFMQGR